MIVDSIQDGERPVDLLENCQPGKLVRERQGPQRESETGRLQQIAIKSQVAPDDPRDRPPPLAAQPADFRCQGARTQLAALPVQAHRPGLGGQRGANGVPFEPKAGPVGAARRTHDLLAYRGEPPYPQPVLAAKGLPGLSPATDPDHDDLERHGADYARRSGGRPERRSIEMKGRLCAIVRTMARSADEELKRLRKRRVTRGLILGGLALGAPAVINTVVARRAARLPRPRWGATRHVEIDGRRLAYVHIPRSGQGAAPPMVLLHTFGPGHTGLLWREAAERLARSHDCLVPDWLGWGDSERKARRYTAGLYIELLDRFLKEVVGEPAILVAPQQAAAYAVQAALHAPERVAAMALVAPQGLGADLIQDPGDPVLHALLRAPLLGTSALNLVTSERSLESHLRRETMFGVEGLGKPLVEAMYRASHLPGASHALTDSLCGRLGHQLTAGFGDELQQPTWLAWGREATHPPLEAADLWLQELPKADLEVLDGCRNLPHVERPAEFAAALAAFIERQRFAA